MPLEERRTRHKALFHLISENDLKSWGELFLTSLTKDPDLPVWHEHLGLRPLLNSGLA
jgi:trehalose-6-phosphate synthase